MKIKDVIILITLLLSAGILVIFSADAKAGAAAGLALAQNTIIPSLIPLLIIFFIIMKTGAKDMLAKAFGFICVYIFNLPQVTLPAVFFGLTGGYPTGALLTNELYEKGEIDIKQAQRLMRFNFCGGCGFIITALGTATLNSTKAGVILFLSNLISAIIIGFILSFTDKRISKEYYSYTEPASFGNALISSTQNAINSVLNMSAYIILFSAICSIFPIPEALSPFIEITNGLCSGNHYPLTQLSAYLSFGGLCIHCQLLPIISNIKMKYYDFLFFRIFSSLLSYCTTRLLLLIIPIESPVFSNTSIAAPQLSSVNIALSILMIVGCFVIIADISSKKKLV